MEIALAVSAVLFYILAGDGELGRNGKWCYGAVTKSVDSLVELERALAEPGELHITLKKDITVSRLLCVKGKKTVQGSGKYRIRRKAGAGAVYKGTLLFMQGETLRLSGVTISGSGKNASMSGDINGKLIECASGTVILDSGTKLSTNYNMSSYTDGGGGITVHAGGKAVMREGSIISDNLSMTGGSGVRVEKGGTFLMEGGIIRDNVVAGQRDDSGFDGRGGALHNRGNVWIQGGIISENFARGYVKEGKASGGYGGAIYNQGVLKITGGSIRDNQASFAGGAIYTNLTGTVLIEGGEIDANRSENQRGGGIYISAAAQVTVKGGSIRGNVAMHGTQIFQASTASGELRITGGVISGGKDAVYSNGGHVIMSGGEIKSTECGLRSKGKCEIRGGTLEGTEYGVVYGEGDMYISGDPVINRIFLSGDHSLTVDRQIHLSQICELCPETYREGKKLVAIRSDQSGDTVLKSFSLRKKKRFVLEAEHDGLYIGRERYVIEFMANGGLGNMQSQTVYLDQKTSLSECLFWREGYGFVGWSEQPVVQVEKKDITFRDGAEVGNLAEHGGEIRLYALWVRQPILKSQYDVFSFYEDENVDRQTLLFGISASDEHDGDLSGNIVVDTIILPDKSRLVHAGQLPTGKENVGKGQIVYRVTNSFGISGTYTQNYELQKNTAPELTVCDRYYFVGDYGSENKADARQNICAGVTVKDDVESEEQLIKNLNFLWEELDFGKAGQYKVRVSVRDQYGSRFYMPSGEERRYGIGKETKAEFTVHVVERENKNEMEKNSGYVRFVSREYMDSLKPDSIWRIGEFHERLENSLGRGADSCEEVWVITGEDKKKIKEFAHRQENPFIKETNDQFIELFSYMKKGG